MLGRFEPRTARFSFIAKTYLSTQIKHIKIDGPVDPGLKVTWMSPTLDLFLGMDCRAAGIR